MAAKLYKNFRGKQNKGYVLAMENIFWHIQPIARNNRLDSSTIAGCITNTWVKASLHHVILLEMCFRQWFERSLEIKSLSTVKVLNLRRLENEFSYSM